MQQGRAESSDAPVKPPTLVSSDGTCGSRLELRTGGKVFALMLDGPNAFRVLDVTAEAKKDHGGCVIGLSIPGAPKTQDSTGVNAAIIRTGWDTKLNQCSQYVTIDGRRWVLGEPASGYLASGNGGRILAGDPRCGGGLPMQP